MPLTGVFFIPSNPNASTALATVTERLNSAFGEEPTLIARWALDHKLMRDTPSCLPPLSSNRSTAPKYMQFLSLSDCPTHGFIYTSQPNTAALGDTGTATPTPTPSSSQTSQPVAATTPMVMTTVPSSSTNTLYQHFVYACQPFWAHRHTVTVSGGMVYDIGDFRVRIGDVRQTQPAARLRGTVAEIEWRGPSLVTTLSAVYQSRRQPKAKAFKPHSWGGEENNEDDDSGIDMAFPDGVEEADIDAEYAVTASLIREFWAKLGVEGAREAILVPDVGKEVKERLLELKKQDKRLARTGGDDMSGRQVDEDPDPHAGVDVARQFMEIFRFNR
ncbi:mediator complex, subunit Med20 [Aspergillus cavernicola]|uniref:Mediator of RNA polymerase II transcription subunit 20 n=1 Tax=Aspergillus cavernicola TaxID=176166 RepID=A0ABR4IPS7_9EURO